MNNLRQRTLVGLGWNGAARLLGQLLQLATTVVLARLLSPKDYGLLGMVLVFTGFAAYIADMGLGASIVQRSELSDRHLNSVFWLSLLSGLTLSVLFVAGAPLVARFYDEPRLRWLTVAIAANFFLGSLNVVQNALLERALNFRAKFWIETTATLSAGTAALVLALAGAGVWSLVAQALTLTAARVVVMWAQSSWRPALAFEFAAIRELMRYSAHLLGFGVVVYWSQNIDKLVIGRTIGSAALGIYSLADRLMRLAQANINDVSTTVMFPALSSIQHDVRAVGQAYLRGTRMIALLTFPTMIALGVLAQPAVLVVYGSRWQDSIPILQLLCVAGAALTTYSTAGWLFLSQGRTDILFYLGIYSVIVRTTGVLIGSRWGLIGVAWAYVIGCYLFIWYPNWASAARLLGLSFTTLLRNVAGPFACAATIGVLLWASDHFLCRGLAPAARLALQLPPAAVGYLLLLRRLRLQAWVEVAHILRDMGVARGRWLHWLLAPG
ncbi:MAG TPA: MOP flippase family protein [Steroidobacteraceae bacterium]|jgi:PST family polysaccharide transporter